MMEMPPRDRTIIKPNDGWLENAWYLVLVSYEPSNPVHHSLFYTGFLNGKNKNPGGYNCLVPINGTADHSHTEIADIHYLKPIKVLYRDGE